MKTFWVYMNFQSKKLHEFIQRVTLDKENQYLILEHFGIRKSGEERGTIKDRDNNSMKEHSVHLMC